MKTTSDPARWEIMKRCRCQRASHPGGGNAIEEQQVAAQKYPKTLQSRTGDKTICLPCSARARQSTDLAKRIRTRTIDRWYPIERLVATRKHVIRCPPCHALVWQVPDEGG